MFALQRGQIDKYDVEYDLQKYRIINKMAAKTKDYHCQKLPNHLHLLCYTIITVSYIT